MQINRGEITITAPLTSKTVSPINFAALLNHFWQSDDAFDLNVFAEDVGDRLDSSGIELVKELAGYLGMVEAEE